MELHLQSVVAKPFALSTVLRVVRRLMDTPQPAGSAPGEIGQMALGASGAFGEPLDGDLAEVAAYSRALDFDEGSGLVAHLVTKWGI